MPEYEYRCKNCQKTFSIERSMSESSEAASCLHCGSSEAARIWGANFITAGAKGGVTQSTAGTQSEACASNPSQPKSCCPCS